MVIYCGSSFKRQRTFLWEVDQYTPPAISSKLVVLVTHIWKPVISLYSEKKQSLRVKALGCNSVGKKNGVLHPTKRSSIPRMLMLFIGLSCCACVCYSASLLCVTLYSVCSEYSVCFPLPQGRDHSLIQNDPKICDVYSTGLRAVSLKLFWREIYTGKKTMLVLQVRGQTLKYDLNITKYYS